MCSHRERAYSSHGLRQDLPESERAQDECILIPLYAQMSDREQVDVVAALRRAVATR
jgi:dTDP-4-amino-4,6-dideoxygalactose transaminase